MRRVAISLMRLRFRYWIAAVLLLQLADTLLTVYGLSVEHLHVHEDNPIGVIAWGHAQGLGLVLLKITALAPFALLLLWIDRNTTHRLRLTVRLSMLLACLAVVIYNMVILLG